jgi:hypothetical protein
MRLVDPQYSSHLQRDLKGFQRDIGRNRCQSVKCFGLSERNFEKFLEEKGTTRIVHPINDKHRWKPFLERQFFSEGQSATRPMLVLGLIGNANSSECQANQGLAFAFHTLIAMRFIRRYFALRPSFGADVVLRPSFSQSSNPGQIFQISQFLLSQFGVLLCRVIKSAPWIFCRSDYFSTCVC